MAKKLKNKKIDESIKETLLDSQNKRSGQFYTPKSIVDHMDKIMEQSKGNICDPACGSSGFLVQASEFIKKSKRDKNDKRR